MNTSHFAFMEVRLVGLFKIHEKKGGGQIDTLNGKNFSDQLVPFRVLLNKRRKLINFPKTTSTLTL